MQAIAVLASTAKAAPVKVDTELLLLVDVSGSVSETDYALMTAAYGRVMTSSAVLNAIQSGHIGKIATSVLFWSSNTNQSVGVSWMEISDFSSAQNFSNLINAATRPFGGATAIGTAIDIGTPMFGSETGGTENGFHSVTQIINVAGDGVDNSTSPRVRDRSVNVAAARDAALAAGVDMINGIAIGDSSGALEQYYKSFVMGGSVEETASFVERADTFSAFESALLRSLVQEINTGAVVSPPEVVPEPSALLFLPISCLLILRRNRSNS
ncbi:MAG: DUF1194 domain-containing protein [Akkermansiaceae bacterium]|nr:DUF1194 domain-containing protein [Akkermansiaceae bacterium]